MACHWRIRHKLILGLGLVVGIIALLLAGTLKGLLSYHDTMRSMECKLQEFYKANEMFDAVRTLNASSNQSQTTADEVQKKVDEVQGKLDKYEDQLQATLNRHRDPEDGFKERQYTEALRDCLRDLLKGVKKAGEPEMGQDATPALGQKQGLREPLLRLVNTANDLQNVIYDRLSDYIHDAKSDYREGVPVVISTSVCAVLLMAGLLRFFYRWVFNPVRDLEIGAGRVAQGDFEHRIEVHSGDEMEDLAETFNNMTGRLREIYRDLAHQVNERSRQLVRSERLASVGFLAAGVAHEINNPLASIAFCSEALEARLADLPARHPADGEVITKYLRMIQQEAFRCKAITQRLLEFSRSGERRREATDLAELIQSVLDVVQHLQNSKGKQVVFDPPGPVRAWVNAQEIKSVVLNLVVNALDSMEEEGRLTITLGQRDGMAEMVFVDTGCGMPPEILENIFEPFFTRSRTGKGTGLGLSISHRVITQHAGEIEATSPGAGQGSTFTVRLPQRPVEAVKEEALSQAA